MLVLNVQKVEYLLSAEAQLLGCHSCTKFLSYFFERDASTTASIRRVENGSTLPMLAEVLDLVQLLLG